MRLFNLARMSTATTGTGTITLGSAVTGWITFAQAGISDNDIVTYAIEDGDSREVGYGQYDDTGSPSVFTLTRNVLNSTNGNAALDLSGSAEVFITASAQDFMQSGATLPNGAAYGNNRPFFDTTRGVSFFYDGFRWLSVEKQVIALPPHSALPSASMNASATGRFVGIPARDASQDFWMEDFHWSAFVATTNNGTNYWTVTLLSDDAAAGSETTIVSADTSADTVNNYLEKITAIDALLGTTTRVLLVNTTKVLTPGNLTLIDCKVSGRLVG